MKCTCITNAQMYACRQDCEPAKPKNKTMKQKLYKLKEEAKKYFCMEEIQKNLTKREWMFLNVNSKCLEEVKPERIEVEMEHCINPQCTLYKVKGHRTEQERADIERLLNLGGFDYLFSLHNHWCLEHSNNIEFEEWLKEKGL